MRTRHPLRPGRRAFGVPVLAAAALALAVPGAAAEVVLSTPVACVPGETCWVQNLVDVDPGPEATDFRCSGFTYDGHSGTDFRIENAAAMARGVAVLAPAPGRVLRVRDGEPDRRFGPQEDGTGTDSGRECGNGIVIDHGGGVETQFCHLKRGSVAVTPGEQVERGTPLGLVGASGQTAFVHVHMTVRRDGKTVDPFTGRTVGDGACGPGGEPMFEDAELLLGSIEARVVNAGFAVGAVEMDAIEDGSLPPPSIGRDAPALVFYGRAANLRDGDRQRIVIRGPRFTVERTGEPLPRKQAQSMIFAGRRAPEGGLDPGIYVGRYEVLREGRILDAAAVTLVLE